MSNPTTKYLDRGDGHLSYDDTGGDGPLVIAAPGMGDLRQVYRFVRDDLADAGIRFVTMDLRGMGETSTDWKRLDDAAIASDYLALVDHLGGGPAILIGNSLSCAASVLAATDAPEKVSGIVLLGPFVREVPMAWWVKAAFGALLLPPWGRHLWVWYYGSKLYPGAPPPDIDAYLDELRANLSEPGRFASFRSISTASHAESGRRLADVTQPVVVVMGTADPDFADPIAEAEGIAEILGGSVILAEGAGHYPQAETPSIVVGAVTELAASLG